MKTACVLVLLGLPLATKSFGEMNQRAGQLEELYIDGCSKEASPYGLYGAFLEPCEFTFFQSTFVDLEPCGEGSELVPSPPPVNWVLNFTEHMENRDWERCFSQEQTSGNNTSFAEDVMVWPDQCVGVSPRCYAVSDEAIRFTLAKLFDGVPSEATHVRVDCRADSLAISRTIYTAVNNFKVARPLLYLWVLTLLVILVGSLTLCSWVCSCLCNDRSSPAIVVAKPVAKIGGVYATFEGLTEETKLLVKH